MQPIAYVVSPYHEKFGAPRQPGLVPAAGGYLEMTPEFARAEAFEGLEGFSHIWVIFGFHACGDQYRLRVRPPRLGGNREVGVFATRSPYRPNHLGLSVLGFEGLEANEGGLRLAVSGLDLIDGSPVFDIKPYVPYSDSLPSARAGFAAAAPPAALQVVFSRAAEQCLQALGDGETALRELIVQSLALDPRPAYRGAKDDRLYGMALAGHNVRWRITGGRVRVEAVEPLSETD